MPAFLGVRLRTFVLATFIGIIPGTFVYASVGAGLESVLDSNQPLRSGSVLTPQILIALIGLALLSLVAGRLEGLARQPTAQQGPSSKLQVSGLLTPDICVIGAGTGGLVVAAGCQPARRQRGPDRIPSHGWRLPEHRLRTVEDRCWPRPMPPWRVGVPPLFGLEQRHRRIDFARVQQHVRGVIDAIAPNDSEERFTGLGVNVLREQARSPAPGEVDGGDTRIRARRFVIATGSAAFVPPVPGLAELPYLTNETIFDIDRLPDHLLIMGGGPIGCELAQALCGWGHGSVWSR